jgi:hypothetical protein
MFKESYMGDALPQTAGVGNKADCFRVNNSKKRLIPVLGQMGLQNNLRTKLPSTDQLKC